VVINALVLHRVLNQVTPHHRLAIIYLTQKLMLQLVATFWLLACSSGNNTNRSAAAPTLNMIL
jgi:hypothetical protein